MASVGDGKASGEPLTGSELTVRWATVLVLAIALCLVDLVTKELVFQWLGPPQGSTVWWIWPNYIGFQTALNHGALFGMGQGMVPVFVVFSLVAVAGIFYWLWSGAIGDWGLTLTLALILGGILGNLYDRLGLWSHPGLAGDTRAVRDWILLQYGPEYVWPNFNLADSFLVCGAALLAWRSLWTPANDPR